MNTLCASSIESAWHFEPVRAYPVSDSGHHDPSEFSACSPGGNRLNGGIQHCVHHGGVWTCADSPTDHKAIETVDHGGEIHLSSRYLERRDVSQPLLIWCPGLEVPINEVNRLPVARGCDPIQSKGLPN